MGKRGLHHAAAFQANSRFEVVGVCDIDQKRADDAAAKFGVAIKGTDAAEVARAATPDVFCFCTLPSIRSSMIKIGIDSGARLIAMEKPVALTSEEGFKVRDLLAKSSVKAVVSHQHRYGEHYQKVGQIAASGALGRINTVYATATGWMMHMLSHLVEYSRWYAGHPDAEWVMARAAGRSTRRRTTSPASCTTPTACTASSSAAPARRTCRNPTPGGASAGSAPRAPTGLPKC
jgi:predicted dehydrogenase